MERMPIVIEAVLALMAAPVQQSSAAPSMAVTMVLLPKPAMPDSRAVVEALQRIDPSHRLRVGKRDKDVQVWELNGTDAFVSLMPVPVPNREAELDLKNAPYSLGKGIDKAPHAAHLIVAGSFGADWRSLAIFTRFVAAIADASRATFVYWGLGHVTQPADHFLEVAREDALPVELWTGVTFARQGSQISLLSLGMERFRLPDLLVEAPVEKTPFAVKLVYDLLDGVLREGKAFPEGDTIGRTADEKLRISYRPSPIQPGTMVWTVAVP
jgi:hypothetical protein